MPQIAIIILIVVSGIIVLNFILYFIFAFVASRIAFKKTMLRENLTVWQRECSIKDDVEQSTMFDEGVKWANQHKEYIHEISITNDGLKQFGQYFDFGFDKCVFILQGRTESLFYSYYFAQSYFPLGYNVLVVDIRAHGLSEGRINSTGLLEYRDIDLWINLVHDKFKMNNFIMHGICIGGATALYTHVLGKNPYIKAIIADGLYSNFYYSYKNHVIERKKPTFIFMSLIFQRLKKETGVDAKKNPPIKFIDQVTIPFLFIYSVQDTYSTPSQGIELYKKCSSDKKKIVFFEKGVHSHVRINAEEKYNKEIKDFLEEIAK